MPRPAWRLRQVVSGSQCRSAVLRVRRSRRYATFTRSVTLEAHGVSSRRSGVLRRSGTAFAAPPVAPKWLALAYIWCTSHSDAPDGPSTSPGVWRKGARPSTEDGGAERLLHLGTCWQPRCAGHRLEHLDATHHPCLGLDRNTGLGGFWKGGYALRVDACHRGGRVSMAVMRSANAWFRRDRCGRTSRGCVRAKLANRSRRRRISVYVQRMVSKVPSLGCLVQLIETPVQFFGRSCLFSRFA